MLVNKFTTEEDLRNMQDGEYIKITKDVALNFGMLEFLMKSFPNSNITIMSGFDRNQIYSAHDTLYDEEETKILFDNVARAFDEFDKEILFDGNTLLAKRFLPADKLMKS